MITRAQAEALLTLAESLEACEREGVEVTCKLRFPGFLLSHFPDTERLFSGAGVREVVNALVPKHTGS